MKARNRIGTTRLATLLLLLAASLAPGIACRTPDCEDYCDEGENYAPKGHECASYDCSEEETDTETGTETGIPEEPVASTIRLIVFYTPDAASEATAYGQDMPTLVEEYVETVNTAFEDSSILHQVELADVQETSLTQAGIVADGSLTGWDSSDVLDWLFHQLADSSSDIQSVRASSGIEADLVMVLGTTFSDVGTGGRAGGITGNTDDPDWAGAVVYWWNELGFAHELGHLFGANHDVYELEADGADTSGYNHGYVERDLGVYTIMAYDSECDFYGIACSRVAYYSNPNLLYMGHPLGEASTAFNACVIQQYGSRVANYYEFLAGTETATEVELESSCPYDMTDTSSSGCSGGTATTDEELQAWEGCVQIDGDLEVEGDSVTSLESLASLEAIHGDLTIDSTSLSSLDGLELLETVECLTISSNPSLASVEGLSGLREVSEDDALSYAYVLIEDNDSLTSLAGLENLAVVAGNLRIEENDALVSLVGLSGLTTLSEGGSLTISQNSALVSLDGLENLSTVEWSVTISQNPALTSLDGLESLTSLPRSLTIYDNDALTVLDGPQNLTSLDSLSILFNASLTSLSGLANLTTVAASITISYNENLTDCALPNVDESSVPDVTTTGNGDGCSI